MVTRFRVEGFEKGGLRACRDMREATGNIGVLLKRGPGFLGYSEGS